MAYAKPRANGKFTAVSKGRSAGTYATAEEALRVAEAQEAWQGNVTSPQRKATITIREYLEPWLKNHQVEESTRLWYRSVFKYYILDEIGDVRVAELQRETVRALLKSLQDTRHLKPATQKNVRSAISAMMTTAWSDGYRDDHPVRGLTVEKRKKVSTRKIRVLSVEEYKALQAALPVTARLLARVFISTGCRPGEAFALTAGDINPDTHEITFDKALKSHGKVGLTKTGDERVLKVEKSLIVQLADWIAEYNLGPDDLLFPRKIVFPRRRATSGGVTLTPELIATLGTKVAPNGQEYQHGTLNCYITAKCRECVYCCQASTDYRFDLERRKGKMAKTPPQYVDATMWRERFREACVAAGLPWIPTAYQLRHTHASWLVNSGEDLKTVMVRLGHASLAITNVYVQEVDDGSSSADIMGSLGLDDDAA